MSGECKSYRLNEPMAWEEFKAMPADLQKAYIKAIRAKYNAPISAIARMLGVDRANLSKYLADRGFEKWPKGHQKWEKMAFAEWCYGVPAAEKKADEAQQPADIVEEEQPAEAVEEAPVAEDDLPWDAPEEEEQVPAPVSVPVPLTPLMAVPESGTMDFTGDATKIMNTLVNLFGGAKIKINVHWDVLED